MASGKASGDVADELAQVGEGVRFGLVIASRLQLDEGEDLFRDNPDPASRGAQVDPLPPQAGDALGEQFRLDEQVQRLAVEHRHLPDVGGLDGQSGGDHRGVQLAPIDLGDGVRRARDRLHLDLQLVGLGLFLQDADHVGAVLQFHARRQAQLRVLGHVAPVPEAGRHGQCRDRQHGQDQATPKTGNFDGGNRFDGDHTRDLLVDPLSLRERVRGTWGRLGHYERLSMLSHEGTVFESGG